MNKLGIKGILLMIFMTSHSSFSMHAKFVRFIGRSGAISLVCYAGGKCMAFEEEYGRLDAPEKVQQWVRGILARAGVKQSRQIAIKMSDDYGTVAGHFITIGSDVAHVLEKYFEGCSPLDYESERNLEKLIAEGEMAFLHEAKHYKNGDFGKACLFVGISCTLFSRCSPYALQVASVLVVNYIYKMYIEIEADRFAWENAASLQHLEEFHNMFKKEAEGFEAALQLPANTSEFWKKSYILLRAFLFDPLHPYFGYRAKIGEKYIQKRKENIEE